MVSSITGLSQCCSLVLQLSLNIHPNPNTTFSCTSNGVVQAREPIALNIYFFYIIVLHLVVM